MFRNFIKRAFRSLWRNRTFSLINIFSLAFGLTCCLLMILFIRNELNYDRFNKNAGKIYRVAFSDYQKQGGFATTPIPVGAAMKDQLPEVRSMTRIAYSDPYLFAYQLNKGFELLSFADESVFSMFSIPFVAGDPSTALHDPNSIVISERLAKKYFGNENPIDKLLRIGSSGALNSVVRGVFKDLSQNSHLQFDCLLSYPTLSKISPTNLWLQMPLNYTYILLNSKSDMEKLEKKLPDFVMKNAGDQLKKEDNSSYNLMLQPLLSIHLQSHLKYERAGAGSMTYVYLFGAIGLIILIIACINFINFASANIVRRMKEIGVSKVVGARRWQLIGQFLSESVLIFMLAAIVAFGMTLFLLPLYNKITAHSFVYADVLHFSIIGGIIIIGIISGLIAGFIPSWSISRLSTINALKGKMIRGIRQPIAGRVLVTMQFVASMILIVASMVVYRQMQFVRKQAASNEGDQLIVFQMNGKLEEKLELLKTELLGSSHISNVSAAANVPGFTGDGWPIKLNFNSPEIQTENYVTDDRYLETVGLKLVAGRKLESTNQADLKQNFILNETAIKELGFHSAADAIGKEMLWGGADNRKRGNIIGVVKDFHIGSFHEKITPAVIQFAPYDWMRYRFMLVKLKKGDINNGINAVKAAVAIVDPNWLVDYKFFDRNFAAMHKKDEQQGRVFTAFAAIAVFISCLGLLGLTIYSIQQRTKEISIRKILGAGVIKILALLSRDFIRLIIIAAFIAFPISWWIMNKWLRDFAYRVNISWWVFVISGLIALLIAMSIIGFRAIKAAVANPVKSLRTE